MKILDEVHNFRTELAYSEDPADEPFWEQVYRQAFPNFVSMAATPGNHEAQLKQGLDRIVVLGDGKVIRIDEKKLKHDYDQFCLEYYSIEHSKTPGWMEKGLAIHFIAYAFMPSRRAYLLPWALLRDAWTINKKQWIAWGELEQNGCRKIVTKNRGYSTVSVAVPIKEVYRAIGEAAQSHIRFVEIGA